MSLLREIQEATTDPTFRLADLLRNAKILAAHLGHQDFKSWIEKELNGYKKNDIVPLYRRIKLSNNQNKFFELFKNYNQSIIVQNIDIALSEEVTKKTETVFFEELKILTKIPAIDNIIKQANRINANFLKVTIVTDMLGFAHQKNFSSLPYNRLCLVPVHHVETLLDTVKTSLLNFVQKIEVENPVAGEATIGTKPIADERLTQIFNQCIVNLNNQNQSNNFQGNLCLEHTMIEKKSTYIKSGRDSIGNISNSKDIKSIAATTLSGTVNNAIEQLKESNSPESQKLAEKLMQLQAFIEEDQNLQPEDKEEAIEQVQVLAEAAKNPNDGKILKAGKTAIKILKGTAATIPLATELVHGVNQLLPEIAHLLHLG